MQIRNYVKMQFEKLCTKFFVISIKCLTLLGQWILLLPLIYDKIMHNFKTQRYYTLVAMFKCLMLACVAPIAVVKTLNMYPVMDKDIDAYIIVMGSMICDVTFSLCMFAAQIWQRQHIQNMLNQSLLLLEFFGKESQQKWVSWKIVALFLVKLVLTLYEIFVDVPFLLHAAGAQLMYALITNYILALGAIISLYYFVIILLIISCLEFVQQRKSQLANFISYFYLLQRLSSNLNEKLQFTIFLILLRYFLNLLANMYGFFYVYVKTQNWLENNVIYCAKFAAELYGLILITHWCSVCHLRVKALLQSNLMELECLNKNSIKQVST